MPRLVISYLYTRFARLSSLQSKNPEPRTEQKLPLCGKNPRGFTLIELLVAISIIAILATVGIISYSKAQSTGRDAKRKQDLRSISVALELYRQRNGNYPISTARDWGNSSGATGDFRSSNGTAPWLTGMTQDYISALPTDPKANTGYPAGATTIFGYSYWSGASSGGSCPTSSGGGMYLLIARLENEGDKDAYGNLNGGSGIPFCDTSQRAVWYGVDSITRGLFVLPSQ